MLVSTLFFVIMKRITSMLGSNIQQKTTVRQLNGLVHAFIASYLSITVLLTEPGLELDIIHSSNTWAENCKPIVYQITPFNIIWSVLLCIV